MVNKMQNSGRGLLLSLKYIKSSIPYTLCSQQENPFMAMM